MHINTNVKERVAVNFELLDLAARPDGQWMLNSCENKMALFGVCYFLLCDRGYIDWALSELRFVGDRALGLDPKSSLFNSLERLIVAVQTHSVHSLHSDSAQSETPSLLTPRGPSSLTSVTVQSALGI